MPAASLSDKSGSYILVMDPAMKRPEIECFNQISSYSSLKCFYHLPAMLGLNSIEALKSLGLKSPPSGIIILGSAANFDQDLPWKAPLVSWLKAQILLGVPTLGICYGHQLIAEMFGAKITYAFGDKTKYKGLRQIDFVGEKLWSCAPSKSAIVVSHKEVVLDCPKEMQIIASSPEVKIDGLKHKSLPVWTFQGHPEANQQFLENQSIVIEVKNPFEFGHNIIKNFLEYSAG